MPSRSPGKRNDFPIPHRHPLAADIVGVGVASFSAAQHTITTTGRGRSLRITYVGRLVNVNAAAIIQWRVKVDGVVVDELSGSETCVNNGERHAVTSAWTIAVTPGAKVVTVEIGTPSGAGGVTCRAVTNPTLERSALLVDELAETVT